MNKTANWENTQATSGSGASVAPFSLGGHGMYILKIELITDSNGNEVLLVYLDCRENGEEDNYFMNLFNSRKKYNDSKGLPTKYPCIYRQRTTDNEGNTNPRFKGLITAIEKSNPGYVWNWNEQTLAKKKVGFVFGEKEYDFNNKHGFAVQPFYPCDYATASQQPVPDRRMLDTSRHSSSASQSVEVSDDELPF